MMTHTRLLAAFLVLAASAHAEKKTRDQLVREDRSTVQEDDSWLYNDLDKAKAEARRTGKPLLIVFR